MLAFVERIAPLAIAENIWPGTSHQILYLMKLYDWRWSPPKVSLQYGYRIHGKLLSAQERCGRQVATRTRQSRMSAMGGTMVS